MKRRAFLRNTRRFLFLGADGGRFFSVMRAVHESGGIEFRSEISNRRQAATECGSTLRVEITTRSVVPHWARGTVSLGVAT